LDDNARKQEYRPASGFRKRPALNYAIRTRNGELPLAKLETTVGRSSSCDLVFESALVSRRHARLLLSETGLFLEDLGSRNGIIVNTTLVRGSARLSVGDRIRIGTEILEIVERPSAPSYSQETRHAEPQARAPEVAGPNESRPTMTITNPILGSALVSANSVPPAGEDQEPEDATRRADVLELLENTADKSLNLGKVEEAERLLSAHLTARLQEAQRTGHLPPDMAVRAARFAIKLAACGEKPAWMDYVISLYTALALPLPLPIVDEMYNLLRKLRGIDRAVLREYVSLLRSNAARYSTEERFALQRVEGLERLAGL
jgi:hypothetical protein